MTGFAIFSGRALYATLPALREGRSLLRGGLARFAVANLERHRQRSAACGLLKGGNV